MMERNGWKITAIIFMTLFILETAIWLLGYSVIIQEEKNTNICYYEICEEYPEAQLDAGVCFCYDYNLLGEYEVVKTKVMD